jgi:hypothetical protein
MIMAAAYGNLPSAPAISSSSFGGQRFTLTLPSIRISTRRSEKYGSVEPDMPADLVVLDYDAMAHDVIDGMVDEMPMPMQPRPN